MRKQIMSFVILALLAGFSYAADCSSFTKNVTLPTGSLQDAQKGLIKVEVRGYTTLPPNFWQAYTSAQFAVGGPAGATIDINGTNPITPLNSAKSAYSWHVKADKAGNFNYTITFNPGNCIVSGSFLIIPEPHVYSAIASIPDLAVGSNYTTNIDFINTELADLNDLNAFFSSSNSAIASISPSTANGVITSVGNMSVPIVITANSCGSAKLNVDSHNISNRANDTNSSSSNFFNVKGPELSITGINFSDNTPNWNETIDVNVTVNNSGNMDSNSAMLKIYARNQDGTTSLIGSSAIDLQAGSSSTQTFQLIGSSYMLDNNINAVIDEGSSIAECNESNNSLTRAIHVTKRNIKVQSVVVSDSTPFINDPVVTITTNVLSEDSTENSIGFRLYIDGTLKESKTINLTKGVNYPSSYLWAPSAVGLHTVDVAVDYSNSVAEADETDNNGTAVIVTHDRDLALQAASLSPGSLLTGETLAVDANIVSLWNSENNVKVSLYVDGAEVSSKTVNLAEATVKAVTFNWISTLALGTDYKDVAVQVKVDPNNTVAEETDANNDSGLYTVSVNRYPNAYVSGFTLSSSTAQEGSILKIDANIAANKDMDVNYLVYDEQGNLYAAGKKSLIKNTITALNTINYTINGAGTHNFRILLDQNANIQESNEADNSASATATVYKENLVNNITLSSSSIIEGSSVTITARARADSNLSNITVKFYSNGILIGSQDVNLAANINKDVAFSISYQTDGTYTIYAIADRFNSITSISEYNIGAISRTLTVNNPAPPVTPPGGGGGGGGIGGGNGNHGDSNGTTGGTSISSDINSAEIDQLITLEIVCSAEDGCYLVIEGRKVAEYAKRTEPYFYTVDFNSEGQKVIQIYERDGNESRLVKSIIITITGKIIELKPTITEIDLNSENSEEWIIELANEASLGPEDLSTALKLLGKFKFMRKATIVGTINNDGNALEYVTTITLRITNDTNQDMNSVRIIDRIPKGTAQDANKVSSTGKFKILKSDPVIEYDLGDMKAGATKEVDYSVAKMVRASELPKIKAPIVLAEYPSELDNNAEAGKSTPAGLINLTGTAAYGVILIVLGFVGAIIYVVALRIKGNNAGN